MKTGEKSYASIAGYFGIPVEDVVWYNAGICYSRIIVRTKESADKVSAKVNGRTANGGMLDGMPLGNQVHRPASPEGTPEEWEIYC